MYERAGAALAPGSVARGDAALALTLGAAGAHATALLSKNETASCRALKIMGRTPIGSNDPRGIKEHLFSANVKVLGCAV
jgi:hypothetical protein